VAAALPLLLAGCAQQGATTQGQDTHDLYVVIAVLAVPVFVGVEGFLLWSIVRYRRRGRAAGLAPQDFGSGRWIALFFAIPTVIVAVLFPYGERTLANVQHRDPNPGVVINVDAFQWQWTFFYVKEGVIETGRTLVKSAVMEIPLNETVHIHLESRDVVHEFFVPAFLFMRNAVPGHPNDFDLTPVKLGTYQGQCAEFCGLWHSRMTFTVRVVTRPEYVAWINSERQAALNVSCPTGGPALSVVAKDISWSSACLAVPARTPLTVILDNRDAGIQHDFAVYDSIRRSRELFHTGRVTGPAKATFSASPLPPGRYYFQCNVHGPAMAGTFIVR
jgi:cytochrome c oxidase subunit 2